jgi:hypothetical protein
METLRIERCGYIFCGVGLRHRLSCRRAAIATGQRWTFCWAFIEVAQDLSGGSSHPSCRLEMKLASIIIAMWLKSRSCEIYDASAVSIFF